MSSRVTRVRAIARVIIKPVDANSVVLARARSTFVDIDLTFHARESRQTQTLDFRSLRPNLTRSAVQTNVVRAQRMQLELVLAVPSREALRTGTRVVSHLVFDAPALVLAGCFVARTAEVELAVLANVTRGALAGVGRLAIDAVAVAHARFRHAKVVGVWHFELLHGDA